LIPIEIRLKYLIFIFAIILLIPQSVFAPSHPEYVGFDSPHKQIAQGIEPVAVKCNDGLYLIIKYNNFPACVKLETLVKLEEHGWGTIALPSFEEMDQDTTSFEEVDQDITSFEEIWEYALEKELLEPTGDYIEGDTPDGYHLARYQVNGDQITLQEKPNVPNFLVNLQDDELKHKELWSILTKLTPQDHNVSVFYLTTDGDGEIAAGVDRDPDDASKWSFFYDMAEAYPNGVLDKKDVIFTTIHEYGHIIFGDVSQVDVIPNFLDASDEVYFEALDACYPNYMSYDGCNKDNSYLNLFYLQFWEDIILEWDEIQYIEDIDEYYEQSDIFYEIYQNRFLTYYSATSPDEDIAEAWSAFVLLDKPDGYSMPEQKILFFYDFPKLVEIRESIRDGMTEIRS